MWKITSKTLVAAALAILVPQLAQAAEVLFVTPFASAPVEVISASNGSVVNPNFTGGNLGSTSDAAFDSSGNVYIAAFGANTVNRYTSLGGSLGPISGFPAAPAHTFSLAFGPLDGALYVNSPDPNSGFANKISRVTGASGGSPVITDLTSSIPNAAAYMAFGPTTTFDPGSGPQTVQPLYYDTYNLANQSTVRVAYINAAGTVLNLGGTLFVPGAVTGEETGIAIDPVNGWLYVASYRADAVSGQPGQVYRYNLADGSNAGISGAVFLTTGNGLTDIALDSTGNLYVLNIGGTLAKYDSLGVLVPGFGVAGVHDFTHSVYGLGIESIPEPASLVLLGFGTMACFRRARGERVRKPAANL